ncbi:M23 family metallopeptidase [Hyphomonas sp. FCG-A18]|uniref:M23 family metallopeptidase n=1 Tax=Hyphomonas sp. FCG-A18 TaxID=3080019 RepID=UPI002B30A35E|nr:M23 family metallopeptidase [Hyphomonas sp. FCG-A18]
MRRIEGVLIAGLLLGLTACGDLIRYPGDGRRDIEPTPPGAPGPPPPSEPVTDPYNEGEPDPTPPIEITEPDPDPGPADPEPDPVNPTPEPDPEQPTPDPDPTPPAPEPEPEPLPIKFQYRPAGDLIPGSGTGTTNTTVYAPDITFPVKDAPAYLQSMVWRFGGGIGGGDQCDPRNYDYPWQDNFCEKRSRTRNTPLCPTNKVHQGQDIRVGTPEGCNELRRVSPADRTLYEAVAVEPGLIEYIGPYWVRLRGDSGILYNYIHLNMARLEIAELDTVTEGQTLGYISNDFGGTPTTFHLHFEIKVPTEAASYTHAPPYMSLVEAYARRESGRGEEVIDDSISIASIPTIPDDFEIIE